MPNGLIDIIFKMEIEKQELEELVERAIEKGLSNKLDPLYVSREKHWVHHEFIDNVIELLKQIKTHSLRAFLWFTIGAIVAGIAFAVKTHFKH